MSKQGFTRRSFLKTTGMATGGLAALPLFSTQTPAQPGYFSSQSFFGTAAPLKIGVLLPRSNIYPSLGQNFASGLQFYFDQVESRPGGREIQLIPQDIGFGYRLVRPQIEKLATENEIKLLAGMVNPAIASHFHGVLETNKAVLLASSLGENLPRQDSDSPYLLHHSLMQWQANWALGRWATQNVGKRAFLATSLYDSGYDAFYTFRLGFEEAGGEIVDTQVTHNPVNEVDFDPTTLFNQIKNTRPDFVFASYSGPQALEFVKAYADAGFSGQIPLLGSSFLVDAAILPELGEAALGIKTASSWSNNLDLHLNQSFTKAYAEQFGIIPDTFALLGFEAARLLTGIVKTAEGDMSRVTQSEILLSSGGFTGPRGPIVMTQPGSYTGPLYLREVRQSQGIFGNEILGQLEPPDQHNKQLEALRTSLKTGWLHGYLSI